MSARLILAGSRRIELTDETVSKLLRDDLRDSACHRFTTVLGPGPTAITTITSISTFLSETVVPVFANGMSASRLRRRPRSRAGVFIWPPRQCSPTRGSQNQTVTIGPWAIAPTYKASKLENCTMSRSDGELGITFVRAQDRLLVILKSQKWKLDRGKAYPVRLTAGSRSVDAKALADTKSVSIALTEASFNSRLRSMSNFEVHAEGATLRVPLDGSSTAFERLEECFNRREAPETNPFVKRNASESNPFVSPSRKR